MSQASEPSPERRRRVNVSRGLFRAWILFSVLWGCGCIGFYVVLGSDPDLTNAKILTIAAFSVPTALLALGAAITWVAVGFEPASAAVPHEIANKRRAWAIVGALSAAALFGMVWGYIDNQQARLEERYRAEAEARRQAELKWEHQQKERAAKEREAEQAAAAVKQATAYEEHKKETEAARQLKDRADTARPLVIIASSDTLTCRLIGDCSLYDVDTTILNLSKETIWRVGLGWAFVPAGTRCPSFMETKYWQAVKLSPYDTARIQSRDHFDGPATASTGFCIRVTDVAIAP